MPKNKIFKEWLVIIFIAFLLSMVIRHFLIDTRIVPTTSMVPTIQVDDRLIVDKLYYKFDTLERGDIVVFMSPPQINREEDLVKRLIGLPGDEILISEGKVYINDNILNEPYIKASSNYEYGPVTVPDNSYFVLGDNRNYSYDSHEWGFLPANYIIGRVLIRYWPIDRFGLID